LKPGDMEALMNRGITYATMGDHNKALEDFNTSFAINPGNKQLLTNIAFEKLQLGMYAETITDCTTALEINPNDATFYSTEAPQTSIPVNMQKPSTT